MDNCVFCKIAKKEISANLIDLKGHRDGISLTDDEIAFNDINPVAATHVVVTSKFHYEKNDDLAVHIVANLMGSATKIAKDVLKLESFRLVTNIGSDAGQQVDHLHVHILGGQKLGNIG